jgi:GNAT superfamily N-acetyltransferase
MDVTSAPLVFGSVPLARRIEEAEVRLMRAFGEAAVALRHPGAFVEPFAGGLAVSGGPGSPITKVLATGFSPTPGEPALIDLEGKHAAAGVEVVFEIATLADLSLVRVLEGRGYRLQRTELVLGCALPGGSAAQCLAADVVIADALEPAVWTRVAVDGFSASEAPEGRDTAAEVHGRAAIAQAAQLLTHGDVRRYLATRAGIAAGAASLRLDEDGIAQCCGATTLVEHRRRGIQTALLYHRLAAASAAGCDLAVVTTEPGSRSHANAQRHGFTPLYARLILSRHVL